MLKLCDNPPHPLVSVSILSADFGRMAEECRDVLSRGADLLHMDVMDGHFAPNLTMGVDMIRGVRRHLPDTYLDVHLMVERPGDYVEDYAAAGANMLTFHVEVCEPLVSGGIKAKDLIKRVHDAGAEAGLVVNPPTGLDDALRVIEPVLSDIQMVLVMSVHPGRSGQKFMPEVLPKAAGLRQLAGPDLRIEMDGGLNTQTCRDAAAHGVDVMVTASALFGSDDRTAVIDAFHRSNA
ncbi:ribulose-phosphate 3-epimerase [Mucisphaera calidilacus]|uniref:Ribulose-phosphate 3-epimerase n=1 Tax=Mucisphaera calidilacus TaxID=2527982 RepID=A0A518C0B4_9BACT|nr:ribulose-phosphate 3-epimerase [Mucisphaera calidilacus]QDU72665.1 Ribulose-phosphate 3-epimerase [Mucisphaera calidilacus]